MSSPQPDLNRPLARLTLRDEAAQRLRSEIVAGLLVPGELYPIAEVAQRLGVSITPVREALLELSTEGLVEIVRNRGFRIRAVSEEDLDEIVELRLMLEVPAVRKLAGLRERPDLEQLRELAHRTERAAAEGDLAGYLEHDRAFHLGLLELAGNARLVQVVARLRDETRLYGLSRLVGTAVLGDTTHEHQELLDAVASGDASRAAKVLTGHLKHARGVWARQEALDLDEKV